MVLLKIARKSNNSDNEIDIKPAPLPKGQFGISDRAAKKIKELLAHQPLEKYFRVAIRGGGCSGFSIHYSFSTKLEHDHVFSHNDAHVLIDAKSLNIISGATLDCKEYLGAGEFFLQNNPHAKSCSCGKSFAL